MHWIVITPLKRAHPEFTQNDRMAVVTLARRASLLLLLLTAGSVAGFQLFQPRGWSKPVPSVQQPRTTGETAGGAAGGGAGGGAAAPLGSAASSSTDLQGLSGTWDREAWIRGFETARTEECYELVEGSGSIPKDLEGTLFRNGHAKFDVNVRGMCAGGGWCTGACVPSTRLIGSLFGVFFFFVSILC